MMTRLRSQNLRDSVLVGLFCAFLAFIGVSPDFIPRFFFFFYLWVYIVSFMFAYELSNWVMNRLYRHNLNRRKILNVWGLLIGGIVTLLVVTYLPIWISELYTTINDTILVGIITIIATWFLIRDFNRRFNEQAKPLPKINFHIWKKLSYILVVFYFLIGVYVGINVANVYVPNYYFPLNEINPLPQLHVIPENFAYPNQNQSELGNSIYLTIGDAIIIYTTIWFNTTIVNDNAVILSAAATTNPSFAAKIFSVAVNYEGTLAVIPNGDIVFPLGTANLAAVNLIPNFNYTGKYSQPISLSLGVNYEAPPQRIMFAAIGNWAPVVTIGMIVHNATSGKNNTDYFTQVYPDNSVYVSSNDLLATDRYNRVNEAISIALVSFGFVEAIAIVRDIRKEDKDETQSESKSTPNENSPSKAPNNTTYIR